MKPDRYSTLNTRTFYLLSVMEDHSQDTIAAVATAPGEGGISIVRISGPESLAIADVIFRGPLPCPSDRAGGTFVRGFICSKGEQKPDEDIDEVILMIYRAPHSYTREDVVEIQGHGGRAAARRILNAVTKAGARVADPGEFTKRAFLSGRIDLLQAEAVADLIRARSDRAAGAALEQLEGTLSCTFGSIYDNTLAVAADLEATLDFEEGELPEATVRSIVERLGRIQSEIETLIATWGEGHVLRDGALVAISGQPNVGKSTLMNRLLGKERAIVADTPGTTRDTIEELIVLNGYPLRLTDTAGLRDADCRIEQEGVARAQAIMSRADIVLYVIDGSRPLAEADKEALKARIPETTVLVLNKMDLGIEVSDDSIGLHRGIHTDLIAGEGVEELREALIQKLGLSANTEPHAAISERHRQLLQNVLNELNKAGALLQEEREDEILLAANSVRDGLHALGLATGRTYSEELLDEIFNRFCVGK